MSPVSGNDDTRLSTSDASNENDGSWKSMTPRKSALMSTIGSAGSGTVTRRRPSIRSSAGDGDARTTATDSVTKEFGRPQPSCSIGPATIPPCRCGKTAVIVAMIAGALATGSSGNSSRPILPSCRPARSLSTSTATLMPSMPPTPFNVRPRKISIAGSNCGRQDEDEVPAVVGLAQQAGGLDLDALAAQRERRLEHAGVGAVRRVEEEGSRRP